jgi:hypothetical protein
VLESRRAARMVKLVDTGDLKSPACKGVPVRFRLRAPAHIHITEIVITIFIIPTSSAKLVLFRKKSPAPILLA